MKAILQVVYWKKLCYSGSSAVRMATNHCVGYTQNAHTVSWCCLFWSSVLENLSNLDFTHLSKVDESTYVTYFQQTDIHTKQKRNLAVQSVSCENWVWLGLYVGLEPIVVLLQNFLLFSSHVPWGEYFSSFLAYPQHQITASLFFVLCPQWTFEHELHMLSKGFPFYQHYPNWFCFNGYSVK